MALIGFQTPRKHAQICKDCARDADLPTSTLREVKDSQFRHGDGGAPCVCCGLDVLDMLARNALRGRTDRELATPDDVDDQVDVLEETARVLDAAYSGVMVQIVLGPGVEPVEQELSPGVVSVDHPEDAPETLVVSFEDEPPYILEQRVESVRDALEAWGWRCEITSPASSDGPAEQLRAVPGEETGA